MRDDVGKDGDMVYLKLPKEQGLFGRKPKGAKKAANKTKRTFASST